VGLAIALGVLEALGAAADESDALNVQRALAGYDARETARAGLARGLTRHPLFAETTVEERRQLDRATVDALLAQAGTDALLLVEFSYDLLPGLDHLRVTGQATLCPTRAARSSDLRELAGSPPPRDTGAPVAVRLWLRPRLPCRPLYRNTYYSAVPAPTAGKGVGRWTADGGAAARRAIEGGIEEVIELLVFDLDQPAQAGKRYEVPGVKPRVFKYLPQTDDWFELRKVNGRTWYRTESGELASIGNVYP